MLYSSHGARLTNNQEDHGLENSFFTNSRKLLVSIGYCLPFCKIRSSEGIVAQQAKLTETNIFPTDCEGRTNFQNTSPIR